MTPWASLGALRGVEAQAHRPSSIPGFLLVTIYLSHCGRRLAPPGTYIPSLTPAQSISGDLVMEVRALRTVLT